MHVKLRVIYSFAGFLHLAHAGGTADREGRSNVQGRAPCNKGDSKEAASTSGEENKGPVWCAGQKEEVGGM